MLSALPLVSARRALWWLGSPAHGDVRYVREGNIWSPVNAASSLHNFFLRAGLWRWDEASPRGPTWRYVAWVCRAREEPNGGPHVTATGARGAPGPAQVSMLWRDGPTRAIQPMQFVFFFYFPFQFSLLLSILFSISVSKLNLEFRISKIDAQEKHQMHCKVYYYYSYINIY